MGRHKFEDIKITKQMDAIGMMGGIPVYVDPMIEPNAAYALWRDANGAERVERLP